MDGRRGTLTAASSGGISNCVLPGGTYANEPRSSPRPSSSCILHCQDIWPGRCHLDRHERELQQCRELEHPDGPNNGGGTFYNVVINGTGSDTITFDASGTVINSLSLGTGETFQDNGHAPSLTVGDPTFPAAGTLTNGGTINWGSGSNLILDISTGNGSIANSGAINLTSSTLTINDSGNSNTAVLSGGGTINLSGGTITGFSGNETLQNNDNSIQGSGLISNLAFVNNGTINANAPGVLTITPNSGGFTRYRQRERNGPRRSCYQRWRFVGYEQRNSGSQQ